MKSGLDLLKTEFLMADGAMGTYFSRISGQSAKLCETANIDAPEIINRIHSEYIKAGARLLRTNTFAAASRYNGNNKDKIADIIQEGWLAAERCAGDVAFTAADIGPVYGLEPEMADTAAGIVIDNFIKCGAEIFLFETFADAAEIFPLCRIIRNRVPRSVIIASFAMSADGFTRKGIALERLANQMEASELVDIWGLNCGIGPNHTNELLRKIPAGRKPLTLMPNSGYPHLEDGRLLFDSSPDYFARSAADLRLPRVKIIGGCCGTTPEHIAALEHQLSLPPLSKHRTSGRRQTTAASPAANTLLAKLESKNKICLCELDPPRDSNLSALVQAAGSLRSAGIDGITTADSPLARVKLDPVTCAARIMRETGQVTLPHLCCRDRNVNSLRSTLLAAHSEGIRQVLAITGDAIPESHNGFVKPVFNINSSGLLDLISQMNQDVFAGDPIFMAAAMDPGVKNIDVEFRRTMKKVSSGARLFLTQPVYHPDQLELIRKVHQEGIKVLVGLMPLISFRNASFMSQEVPGIRIPENILARFSPVQKPEDAIGTGIEIVCEMAAQAKDISDGFYLIAPFNRVDIIRQLMQKLNDMSIFNA